MAGPLNTVAKRVLSLRMPPSNVHQSLLACEEQSLFKFRGGQFILKSQSLRRRIGQTQALLHLLEVNPVVVAATVKLTSPAQT